MERATNFGDRNSNVVKFYSTLIIDSTHQVGYYHPGVGTMGAPTAHNEFGKAWSMVMGLAFGAGLLANVGDAYRYLMNAYEDGDHVFLFGFSRGAYTARALAGVLHMFGLLYPGNVELIPYIIRLYAQRTRKAAGITQTFQVADEFKVTFCRHCPLHFVGVWDTVSSVGWIWNPVKLPYAGDSGKKEQAVIHSLLSEYPLGLIYFNKVAEDKFEVLDGQQRITSVGRFVTNKFAIMDNGNPKNFDSLPADQQAKIRDSKLLIYECEGTESEIKQWFETINIAGVPLNPQELLNAIYSGPFVTLAKAEFSNSQNANIQKWSAYVKGSANRQQFLERALDWVSKGDIGGYMSRH